MAVIVITLALAMVRAIVWLLGLLQQQTQQSRDSPITLPSILVEFQTSTIVEPATEIIVEPGEPVLIQPINVDPVLVEPSRAITVGPVNAISIEPPPRGAWDDKGWIKVVDTKGKEEYSGHFQIVDDTGHMRRYPGRVTMKNGIAQVFIAGPPPEIKRHPRGGCFQQWQPEPWFFLHWNRPANNPDDALLYMEKLLTEAFEL